MSLRKAIQVGMQVLNTTLSEKKNKIFAQLGDIRGVVDSDNAEWMQHVGFASRPSKVVKDSAGAHVVTVQGGDHDTVIASQDARGLALYGNLKEGETALYGAGTDGAAQGRVLIKADGSVTTLTTQNNVPGAKSIYARVGTGLSTKTGAPDGFSWVAPWGTMKFDATGFHIVLTASGVEFHLGGVGGLPPPLDKISSYCNVTAGTFRANVTNATVGIGTVQLANSAAVLVALTGIQAALVALAGKVEGMPSGTGASTAIAPAAAALAIATPLMTTTASADL